MKILVLNAGSSSQKNCLYHLEDTLPNVPPEPLWEAKVDWSRHQGVAELKVKTTDAVVEEELRTDSRSVVMSHLLDTLTQGKLR